MSGARLPVPWEDVETLEGLEKPDRSAQAPGYGTTTLARSYRGVCGAEGRHKKALHGSGVYTGVSAKNN